MFFHTTLGVSFGRRRDERHEALGEGQGELIHRILGGTGLVARSNQVGDHFVVVRYDQVLLVVRRLEDVLESAIDLLLDQVSSFHLGIRERPRASLQKPDIVLFRAEELFLASSRATFLARSNSRFIARRDASLPCPFFICASSS